jgi:hypothetical protein
MMIITVVQTVQIPVLAAMLLGGFMAKLIRAVRLGSMDAGLGPTALFSMRLRRPVALAMCALECGLGLGLIVTAGRMGRGAPVTFVRLGTALLFLVATCALLELRASRPDIGCGCFGDFSHSPVDGRTVARSAFLAAAALITLPLPPLRPPSSRAEAVGLLALFAAELAVIAALSPELGEALVRLGYSEPCELRIVPTDRTLATLRRSKQWRRHAEILIADEPVDTWRELCWRFLVFPGRHGGRDAEVVFAVFLRPRRPLIHAAVVDAVTGRALPWPGGPARTYWPGGRVRARWSNWSDWTLGRPPAVPARRAAESCAGEGSAVESSAVESSAVESSAGGNGAGDSGAGDSGAGDSRAGESRAAQGGGVDGTDPSADVQAGHSASF